MNAIVAPRLAADVSRVLHPTPTAFDLQQAVHHDTYDGLPIHDYNVRRAADLRARLFAEHAVSRVEDLPVNFRGIDYLEREAHSDAIWDDQFGRIWGAFDAQAGVHHAAGFVAPLLAVRALSMAFAGADYFHHRHFAASAEAYRRQMVLSMNRNLAYGGTSAARGAYAATPALWTSVAPFTYQSPSVSAALSPVRPALWALTFWLVVGLTSLAVAVRHMAIE